MNLATIAEIADLLHVSYWRVEYICRAKPEIKALGVRVGASTVFDPKAVRKIATAIEHIDTKRRERIPASA